MKSSSVLLAVALCGAMPVLPIFAEQMPPAGQKAKISPEERIERYVNGNLFGIQSVKKNSSGRIVSLVSIGRAPVSSTLTQARAKNQAFKRADAFARAEFMKWLTTAVTYARIDHDDVAIVAKGESIGNSGTATETSEAGEFTQEQVVSVASGFVKGMVQIGAGISDENEAVVILGWNADTAEQVDAVRDGNSTRKSKADNRVTGAEVKPPNVRTSTSEAAGDFL